MRRYIWEINFDLDTKLLQENYPSDNWRKAYNDIFVFMNKNGFEHRQGSGYISKTPISEFNLESVLTRLVQDNLWLADSVRKIDTTVALRTISRKELVNSVAEQKRNERQSVRAAAMTRQHFSSGRKR